MERYELEARLGPALEQLTPEQISRLAAESDRIDEIYPEPGNADRRQHALTAATQYLLGETDTHRAGQALAQARGAAAEAAEFARQVVIMAVEDGMSEYEAARQANVDRMTIRAWLGKR